MVGTLHDEISCIGLVVDDDDMVRESISAVLADMCDAVYEASDGQEGLEILENHPDITVVVTDIAMPRLDGITFANRARQLHPELRVLFVSGMQVPPASETYLVKPFGHAALVSAVQRLLASAPRAA